MVTVGRFNFLFIMNKLFIIVLLCLVHSVKGQDSLLLKFVPLPNKIYKSQIDFRTKAQGKLERKTVGTGKFELSPTNLNVETVNTTESAMTTENEENNRIPYIWKFIHSNSFQKLNGKTSEIYTPLDGSTIYGFFDMTTAARKIDSVMNDELEFVEKLSLKNQLEQSHGENTYSDVPIAIGASFEKERFISIPVLGADDQEFIMTNRYTLKKIEKGIGYLESNISFRLKSPNNEIQVLPNTNGFGIMQFDTKNQCVINETSEYNIYVSFVEGENTLISQIWSKDSRTTKVQNKEFWK